MSERDDRACDSCQKSPCGCRAPQAAAEVPWRVGQRRRGVLLNNRGESMGFDAEDFVVLELRSAGEWWIQRHEEGPSRLWYFREKWPSVILADSPGTAPAPVRLPQRSSASLPPAVGMVVDYVRTREGVVLVSTPWTVVASDCPSGGGGVRLNELENNSSWDNGQYDILSMPPAAPAHVCKGRPCGELVDNSDTPADWVTGKWVLSGAHGLRRHCSPACRDAWKPVAKVACPGCAGKPLFEGRKRVADLREACAVVAHRAANQMMADEAKVAQPAPAPWKCSGVTSVTPCRTPDSPPALSLGKSTPSSALGRCMICFDIVASEDTAWMYPHQQLTREEAIGLLTPWTILPGQVPARRPATDGLPGGESTVRNDSVWSDT